MIEKIQPSSSRERDHMANERTFLAWIRTSIGIMAFGFIVEKFSIFMRQMTYFLTIQGLPEHSISNRYSSVFGLLLVGIGGLIGLFSFIRYRKVEEQIEKNIYQHSPTLAAALTALVVVMGIVLLVYLMFS